MKILQVAYKAEITGGEMVLWDLARALVARGHEVHAVASTDGPLLEVLRRERVAVAVIPMRKTFDPPAVRRLAAYLRDNGIELVQSHGMLVNILTRQAARRVHTPISLSTVHSTMELGRSGRARSLGERLKAIYYRWLDNRTAAYNDRVICVSEAVRQDKIEQGIPVEKLVTIRNGIDLNRFAFLEQFNPEPLRAALGIPAGAPLVGTIARFSRQKDVATLIKAMPTVWAELPEARLLLIGSGYLEDELRALTNSLDRRGRICFAGYRQDARRLLACLDVFCLPSLCEGLPLVVLEAMACAKPVVCTPVPGTLEAVVAGETGVVTPFGDCAAMGIAVTRLLADGDLRLSLGAAGRRRLEDHFNFTRVERETVALYNSQVETPA